MDTDPRPPAASARPAPASHRAPTALAGLAFVAATPIVTWFAVGDQSSPNLPASELDFYRRPPQVSEGLATVARLGSAVVLLVAAVVLFAALRRLGADERRRWARVVGLPAAAGVFVGWAWREETAGGVGASIGGGLLTLVVPFVVAAALAGAWKACAEIRRGDPAPLRGINAWETRY